MITGQPTKPNIPAPVRSRINSLAHHLAALEETRIRAALLARVQAAADGGASVDALRELVDKLRDGSEPLSDGLASHARICDAKP